MERDIIKNWNNNAKYKGVHKKIIDTRINLLKSFTLVVCMVVAVGFLSLYGIRLYYYDLFKDITEITHICQPNILNNITIESTNCGDNLVEVDCDCLDNGDLKKILSDVCPETINVYLE